MRLLGSGMRLELRQTLVGEWRTDLHSMLLPLELHEEDKTGAWRGQCQLGSLRAELLEAPLTMDWVPFYVLPLVFSTGWSIPGHSGVRVSSKNSS